MTTPLRGPPGAQTKQRIIDAAIRIAERQGLFSLTFGTLADDVGMSKSGLFAHFGEKEMLLVDVVAEVEQRFFADVVTPATAAAPGMARLGVMMSRFLANASRVGDPERCFLFTAAHELDGRPGAARARLQEFVKKFRATVDVAVAEANAAGHFKQIMDPERFFFTAVGYALATTWSAQLGGDPGRAKQQGLDHLGVVLRIMASDAGALALTPRTP